MGMQLESVAKISNLQRIAFQYIEAHQYIEAFQCIRVIIGLQHFNILGYHRIAILQYIANYLFLRRTLTVEKKRITESRGKKIRVGS